MTISGNQTWNALAHGNIVPVAATLYDSNITGFRFVTPADYYNSAAVVVSPVSNNVPGTVTGQIFAANTGRKAFYVKNLSTGSQVYLNYTGAAASSNFFNVVLKADSPTNDAGNGGDVEERDYKGEVFISGSALRYIKWEI